jgi:hypothetical protein
MTLRGPLTTAMLMGTGQQSLELPASGAEVDGLIAKLKDREAPQRLLDSAALIVSYERAGAMPARAAQAPAPAEEDARPRCSPAAAAMLVSLLEDRRALLREWLSLSAEKGVRPPEEMSPALLDAATSDRSVRETVVRACGPLAAWLARFREEWSWVGRSEVDESVWETGTFEERVAMLSQLRAADPGRCAAMVEAVWATEPADHRRKFVEAFATGLTLADEAFLERALDDRNIVVRRAAAELLASISGSQLVERMKARVSGRVRTVRVGLLRKTALDVEPFDAVDAAMLRDGIEKKAPAGAGLGERAWWTMQAIAAVPPAFWCEQFRMKCGELIEAATQGQWEALLCEAWRRAAIRYRAADWLEALADGNVLVFGALPNDARERCMRRLLKEDVKKWIAAVPNLCVHAWSATFTEYFVDLVERNLPTVGDPLMWQIRTVLREAGMLAWPMVRCPEEVEVFKEFADTVAFRRRMREAIR